MSRMKSRVAKAHQQPIDNTFGQVSAFIRRPSCADQWLGDTCGHMESRIELA